MRAGVCWGADVGLPLGGLRLRGCLALIILATAPLIACSDRSWVSDFPDIAELAQRSPESFVEPTFAQWAGIKGLSGSYWLHASRGIGRAATNLWIAARRPGELLIEVLAPTGSTEAQLWANPGEVALWLADERVLYRGPAHSGAFQLALGLDLSPEDAIAIFIGYGIDRLHYPPVNTVFDKRARRIRLDFGNLTSIWLHPATLHFDRVLHRQRGGEVDIDVVDWIDGIAPVPSELTIRLQADGISLHLRHQGEWYLNPEFRAGDFDVREPTGSFITRPLSELASRGGLLRRESGQ